MKNVCVSTYCEWSSYGSVMQAIGLKKCLADLGYNSFIVRDEPAPVSQKTFSFSVSSNPKIMLRNIMFWKLRKQRSTLYKNSVKFIRENLDVRYFNDYEVLKSYIPNADYYIAGSDQIWHPALCKRAFFLDFLPPEKKRLSYAASMGVLQPLDNKKELFGELISKFDSISVREKEMTDVLAQYTEKSIMCHIDPTFLVDAKYWDSLSEKYPIEKPYILVYAIYWDKSCNNELKKLHKQTGCDIVALCPNGPSSLWANKRIYDANPGQFLYLIKNAEAVVSSSFHGVALSVNFNKKIAPVINPKSPSRISSLLNILGIKPVPISDVMKFDESQYAHINRRIEEERARSIDYLREVLK